ncbi:MAG: 4-vinyl reductase [Anaerolineales bacterium]|nr:4-vinyl reductase [Anaerolineales bacterium]
MDIAASWPVPPQALPDIYPAKIGGLMMSAYEEVLGGQKFALALHQAGLEFAANKVPDLPFGAPARIYQALEEIYGEQTARGICLRTGRVMFRRGLRAFSGILGLSHRGFRLLPPAQKVLRGMDLLAWTLNHYSDQRVRIEKCEQEILLINERCPHCWELEKSSPCCQLPVGALQEGLAWACSARQYTVEEITCRAKGDPSCTFRVKSKSSA